MADDNDADDRAPNPADVDQEYTPERNESAVWLHMIAEYESKFKDYNDACDRIGRKYADLNRLRGTAREREFQLLWSTCEVIKPSIYSRPPEPVVVPRFKDRRPLYRTASEVLERAVKVQFDLQSIDDVMLLIRDDLTLFARGVPWVRYESDDDGDRVCIEMVDRCDFAHELSRNWNECGWVARRCWMTMEEMRERFYETSGDAYMSAGLKVMREANEVGGATQQMKAPVWEIWSKCDEKVVWVSEGVDVTLDEGEPHIELEGVFPCPRPAYGTVQPGGLMPVPDFLFYKDQAEEVDAITNRIHALSTSVRVRGFYASGNGDASQAIERALQTLDDNQIIIGVPNIGAFGPGGSEIIQWLPLEQIVSTIAQLIEFRRQLLDDVYQIVGIADIMRGSTDATETATAQRLKSQAGSIRIKGKQNEIVRVSRDLVRIAAEIIAENFDQKAIFEMAQTDTPTDADIRKRVRGIEQQAKQIADQAQQAGQQLMQQAQQAQDHEAMQQAQQQLEQIGQQADQQIQQLMAEAEKVSQTVTQEQVVKFFRDERIRPFVLDVETDSTILVDEDAEKQRRAEALAAFGGIIGQFGPVLEQYPELAPLFGETVKFGMAPYRMGREMDNAIDEAIDKIQQRGKQDNPEAEAARAEAEDKAATRQLEMQRLQMEMQDKQAEREAKAQELQAKLQIEQEKSGLERMRIDGDLQLKQADIQLKQIDAQIKIKDHEVRQMEAVADQQRKQQDHEMSMVSQAQNVRDQQTKTALNVQSAQAKASAKIQNPQNQRGMSRG